MWDHSKMNVFPKAKEDLLAYNFSVGFPFYDRYNFIFVQHEGSFQSYEEVSMGHLDFRHSLIISTDTLSHTTDLLEFIFSDHVNLQKYQFHLCSRKSPLLSS